MGKMSRTKGHNFERNTAIALRVVFPNARRQLEYHADDCRSIDLVETGAFKIQCKKMKRYASITAIEEIQCDPMLGDIPVLITAGDNKPTMVVLPFEDFLNLISGK